MKTTEAAKGKWPGILRELGIDERYLQNWHGPCPLCGGKDRYRFDDKDGSGSYYCNQCGPGNGMDLAIAITGKPFSEIARDIDGLVGNIDSEPPRSKSDPAKRINKIYQGASEISQDGPVIRYLRSRGLPKSTSLLEHRDVTYYDDGAILGSYPAMVAPVLSPEDELVTLHITYLEAEGKARVQSPRKMLPRMMDSSGACVRLTGIYETIGVAEGIETALAVMKLYRVPCWSTLNAPLMEKFRPPVGVKSVTVFADNDLNYSGQKSAYTLANRLSINGYQTDVVMPELKGRDFADDLEDKNNKAA